MSTQHDPHPQQPDPDVDVVPGDPPVPVNIWRLPTGEDTPVGDRLATRLLAEYTRPGELVYDTLPSPALRTAAQTAGRSYRAANRRFQTPAEQAALAVATWPVTDHRLDPVTMLENLRRRLQPRGFLAVVVTTAELENGTDTPVELGPLVAAAIAAGLSYLQHIVTMPTSGPDPQPPAPVAAAPATTGGAMHQRVHTDLLVFTRIGNDHA